MNPQTFFETDSYLVKNNISIRKNIIDKMNIDFRSKSLLDLGCANGSLSLMNFDKLSEITFVDTSSFMLEQLKNEIQKKKKASGKNPEITIIHSDILKTDLDKKFDIIFCIGVLSYVSSLDEAFQKLKKYIKKDGLIIIQYSNNDSFEARIKKKSEKRKELDYVVNYTTSGVINDLINKSGLKIVKKFIYPETSFRKMLPFNFVSNFKNFVCDKSFLNGLFSEEILLLSSK